MMRIVGGILIITLSVTACATPEPTPTPDTIATGVAQQRAIAATLTAEAPAATQPPPTELPSPTPPPPQSTVTQPPPPTDTPPPPQEEAGQIVPALGTTKGLVGEIVVHNYPGPIPDVPIFDRAMAFRLRVRDPDLGEQDGAGITSVDFSITSLDTGETVHTRTERVSGYCAFGGGEPICNVFDFAASNFTWTNGQPVVDGFYEAEGIVHTQALDKDGANWRFTFEVRLP